MSRPKSKHKYRYHEIDFIEVDSSKPFGPQLSFLRKKNNITLREIADRMAGDPSNVCHWEKGDNGNWSHFNAMLSYCKAFNVKEVRIKIITP